MDEYCLSSVGRVPRFRWKKVLVLERAMAASLAGKAEGKLKKAIKLFEIQTLSCHDQMSGVGHYTTILSVLHTKKPDGRTRESKSLAVRRENQSRLVMSLVRILNSNECFADIWV